MMINIVKILMTNPKRQSSFSAIDSHRLSRWLSKMVFVFVTLKDCICHLTCEPSLECIISQDSTTFPCLWIKSEMYDHWEKDRLHDTDDFSKEMWFRDSQCNSLQWGLELGASRAINGE